MFDPDCKYSSKRVLRGFGEPEVNGEIKAIRTIPIGVCVILGHHVQRDRSHRRSGFNEQRPKSAEPAGFRHHLNDFSIGEKDLSVFS